MKPIVLTWVIFTVGVIVLMQSSETKPQVQQQKATIVKGYHESGDLITWQLSAEYPTPTTISSIKAKCYVGNKLVTETTLVPEEKPGFLDSYVDTVNASGTRSGVRFDTTPN